MSTTHARTCHICEANCGILVEIEDDKVLSVKGNPDHVLSEGYICPKATAIPDLQDDPDRLRRPLKKVDDEWEEVSWETAFREIAERFAEIVAGPKIASIYLGNPIAHNYGVTTQMRSFIKAVGTRGIYSASTLDQIPHLAAQKFLYGHNANYPVPDIDRTNYMLIVGGNPAASNGSLWTVPNVRARIKALRARGGKLVVVDPRHTETAKIADEHYFVRPSTDTAFFIGLLLALDEAGLVNPGRLQPMLSQWEEVLETLRDFDLTALSDYCGISVDDIRHIASELGGEGPTIIYGRMGVSVTRYGSLNHWLIQLINIATGNLDREGGVLFNVPAIDPVENSGPGAYGRYQTRLSGRPDVFGELPAVEMAAEISTPGEGQIGALFTVAGNPVLSTPGGRQLDGALEKLDLMVSVDMYVTETTRHADYILPPCGPLQKDHFPWLFGPVFVRQFVIYSPPLFAKEEDELEDWEIVAGLVTALNKVRGVEAPETPDPRTALDAMLKESAYNLSLEKVEAAPNGIDLGALEPQLPGRLKTESGKIECAPAPFMEELQRFSEELSGADGARLRLVGRRHIRSNNSWLHNSKRLIKGANRCTLMIHPDDAEAAGVRDGALVRVSNHVGAVELPAEITDDVMRGVVSIPHGYGHDRDGVKLSVAGEQPGVSINDLTDPAQMDLISGNAVLNGTPVEVEPA